VKKYALKGIDPVMFARAKAICKNYSNAVKRLSEAKEKQAVYDSKIANTDSNLKKAVFVRKREELARKIAFDLEIVDSFDRVYGSLIGCQKLVIEQLYIRKVKWDELVDAMGRPITRSNAAWERKKALCVMAQELEAFNEKRETEKR